MAPKNKVVETPAIEPAGAPAPATPAAAVEKKKKAVAEHDWINSAGDVVEDLEAATGIKYRDQATDQVFTYQIPGAVAGEVRTMFAVWGARTKATNTASAAFQKRENSKSTESSVDAMVRVFGEIKDGQWAIPSASKPKLPQYDLDVLAQVIYDALVAEGAENPDLAKVRAKCGDSPTYCRGAMQMESIAKEYNSRKGIVAKPVLSLLV